MEITIEPNPNCPEAVQFVFNELEAPRAIRGILTDEKEGDKECDVVGVTAEGRFVPAQAVRITDSGDGTAFLIYGGDWGIRLRPRRYAAEAWDFANTHQWGESFKVYASDGDILFSP